MKFVFQTTFGGIDAPPQERGNCDLACLSTITGIPLEQIPRYNEAMGDYGWHIQRNDFLRAHGFYIVTFSVEALRYLPDSYCIAVGPSPRGDWDHSVVGRIQQNKLSLIHDPHPAQAFFLGKAPKFVAILFRLYTPEE